MGVEVGKFEGFEVAQAPFELAIKSDKVAKENGKVDQDQGQKVSIKFGSHGDEKVKAEENNAFVPKDAVEEWPAAKQIHTFYFVRSRPYDDPKLKAKMDQADREIQKLNQTRVQIIEELKAKRAERADLFDQLEPLKSERKGFNTIFDEKRKEMEPLQQALGKLRNTDGGGRGTGGGRSTGICSSEEELNDLIYSLQYRIQHESIPLSEEKQILKEIKQLEGTRDKVIANAAMRAKIKESLGHKDEIQDQVKLMGNDLDGVKKGRQAVTVKIGQLSERLKATKEEIVALEEELKTVIDKRDKAVANIQGLRKQRDEANSGFYQGRTVLNKARELAANKNIKALEEFSHAEVEKFMSQWNGSKVFRDDYEKRILASLDARQLSRDGRMRNPDEKPLLAPQAPPVSETVTASKPTVKKPKEEPKPSPKPETPVTVSEKVQKETSGRVKEPKTSQEHDEVVVKTQNDAVVKEKEVVDEAKLKAMKREEELAKAKQAMERKKKLAEKAAAKAAIRAQKEAEKKLKEKEREKKAKKKAGVNSLADHDDSAEAASEDNEAEKVEAEAAEAVKEKPEIKEKASKERTVRSRARAKGADALPRAILKRKKSTNYWVWAAPAALAVLMLVALVYYYAL